MKRQAWRGGGFPHERLLELTPFRIAPLTHSRQRERKDLKLGRDRAGDLEAGRGEQEED